MSDRRRTASIDAKIILVLVVVLIVINHVSMPKTKTSIRWGNETKQMVAKGQHDEFIQKPQKKLIT